MNKRDALKTAKAAFPYLDPRMPGSFSFCKGLVIVTAYGGSDTIVFYGRDLAKLKGMIEAAEHAPKGT